MRTVPEKIYRVAPTRRVHDPRGVPRRAAGRAAADLPREPVPLVERGRGDPARQAAAPTERLVPAGARPAGPTRTTAPTTRGGSSACSPRPMAEPAGFLACTLYTPGGPQAQKVYVHAKVGIVDDRWLTLGSANLNEHSLFNDTEVNVVINDEALATSTRQRLFAEHLELPREQVAGDARTLIDERWRPDRAGAARTARGRRPADAPARPAPACLTALEAAARPGAEPARRWLAPPRRGLYSPQGWDGRERGSRSFSWGARPVPVRAPAAFVTLIAWSG